MAGLKKNTAILIIHGIGNQNPLETLDGFSRGLVGVLEKIARRVKLVGGSEKFTTETSSYGYFKWARFCFFL